MVPTRTSEMGKLQLRKAHCCGCQREVVGTVVVVEMAVATCYQKQ